MNPLNNITRSGNSNFIDNYPNVSSNLTTQLKSKAFSNSIFGEMAAKICKFMSLAKDIQIDEKHSVCLLNKDISHILVNTVKVEHADIDLTSVEQKVSALTSISIFGLVKMCQELNEEFLNKLFDLAVESEIDSEIIEYFNSMREYILKRMDSCEPTIDGIRKDLIEYAQNHPSGIQYVPRLLSRLHSKNDQLTTGVKVLLKEIANKLSESTQKNYLIQSVSSETRDALRAPTDVIFDLLSFLKSNKFGTIENKAKELFMKHQLTIENTRNFLKEIQSSYPNTKVEEKCQTLDKQLMVKPIYTQLNDNIYGRVFDTYFVSELVDNPPSEVSKSMTSMSKALGKHLQSLNLSKEQHEKISSDILKLLADKDPRFWFPAVPELNNLATNKEDPLNEMIIYLNKDKLSGYECISIPYLMVKLSLILKENGISPPWLQNADEVYNSSLHPLVRGIRVNKSGEMMNP